MSTTEIPLTNANDSNSSGASNSTTPKLKLTFKLAEIRAASPATVQPTVTEQNVPSSLPVVKKKRMSKKKKLEAQLAAATINGKEETTLAITENPSTFATPHGGKKNTTPTIVVNNALSTQLEGEITKGRASTRVQFTEQIQFVREMQKIKVRKWRLESSQVRVLGDRFFSTPCWAKERTIVVTTSSGVNGVGKKKGSNSLPTTFVCTFEECHKIFDEKEKWKRHQYNHKKKAKAATNKALSAMAIENENKNEGGISLQLKLNVGALKKSHAITNETRITTDDYTNNNPLPSSTTMLTEDESFDEEGKEKDLVKESIVTTAVSDANTNNNDSAVSKVDDDDLVSIS